LGLAKDADHFVIGGDFLTSPHVDDMTALKTGTPTRWGPPGATAYHLVVPPRPHAEVWLSRAR
jgi:hypothetical protein